MSQSYHLGQVLHIKSKRLLVVRIVQSRSLFEPPDGTCYILNEHYIELRDPNNQASFIRLGTEQFPFTENKGNIKALPPIYFKEEDEDVKTGTTRSEGDGEG